MSWWMILLVVAVVVGGIAAVLPRLLQALGVHPHYDIPTFDVKGTRALVITTSHDKLGESLKTGVFGSEMTVPYYAFLDAGMQVDLASIKGGEIPIDPLSGWPLATPEDRRFDSDPAAMKKLKNSIAVKDVNLDDYDVLFMAGGWGASYDLAQSDELADLITRANAQGKVLSSVCHGALGLVSAKGEDGEPLLKGRRATGVTDRQIQQLRITATPKHPETEMRKVGCQFESNTGLVDMFATHVVVDGNLVTGQNQNSGYETAHRVLEIIDRKQKEA